MPRGDLGRSWLITISPQTRLAHPVWFTHLHTFKYLELRTHKVIIFFFMSWFNLKSNRNRFVDFVQNYEIFSLWTWNRKRLIVDKLGDFHSATGLLYKSVAPDWLIQIINLALPPNSKKLLYYCTEKYFFFFFTFSVSTAFVRIVPFEMLFFLVS